jgi:glycerate 2-kinase
VAPDKFKGSLTAREVANHLATGLRATRPDRTIITAPVADGGDGTLDAALAAGYRRVPARVTGPTGQVIESAIGVRGNQAVIELAAGCGLVLLPGGRPDPLHATSRGVGDLIRAALDAGCDDLLLGVGGSASTDGGAGMLQALGARLLDRTGTELASGGGALLDLDVVDLTRLDHRLGWTRVVLAADVDSPLLGPTGAARVFAPQKGASPDEAALLERALSHWAAAINPAAALLSGAGAAGGVGFASMAVLNAHNKHGIDVILELINFNDQLRGAALVITGEGALDQQTLAGKAPVGVAAAARKVGVPVVAVCGRSSLTRSELLAAGIIDTFSLEDVENNAERRMTAAGYLVEGLAVQVANAWL